jgi:hypothetical protein
MAGEMNRKRARGGAGGRILGDRRRLDRTSVPPTSRRRRRSSLWRCSAPRAQQDRASGQRPRPRSRARRRRAEDHFGTARGCCIQPETTRPPPLSNAWDNPRLCSHCAASRSERNIQRRRYPMVRVQTGTTGACPTMMTMATALPPVETLGVLRALASAKRLQILEWLRDPSSELPAAARRRPGEGRGVRHLHRRQARRRPAHRHYAPAGARPRRSRQLQTDRAVDVLQARRRGDPRLHAAAPRRPPSPDRA